MKSMNKLRDSFLYNIVDSPSEILPDVSTAPKDM